MNENNTKTAAARLRELYPNYSLSTAINLLIDRVERAEEAIKKYSNEAVSAKEKAYEFDKRYCDLLVENRKLKNGLKEKVNAIYGTCTMYMGYPVDPENPENCKVRLDETVN